MKIFRFLLIAVICILAGGRGIALGQCIPPPSGLVAWWPLDETSSPANDLAGVNNVGTWMNNPTPVSGKVAGALSFDNDYVEVQDHSELNFGEGDFSIDAWVKRDTASTNSPPSMIVDKRDVNDIGYALGVSYGRLVFRMCSTNYATTTYPVPADGQWHHVAVTVNRATNVGRFYSDGIPLDMFTPPPCNLNNTNPLLIGAGYLGGNQPWLGCIDELELFNRALDSLEVHSIWAADSLGKCKPSVRNHYKTWRIQPLPFDTTVFVQDQFMQDTIYIRLDSIDFLSNPAKKVTVENDTFDIRRPNDHLTWYRAKSFAPLKKFHVDYVNQFESTSVWIDTLKYLLVPTRKFPHDQPVNLDHYIGYKIETVRWWLAWQFQLQDQFDSIPENIYNCWSTYFFTPARKNNEPVYDTTTHYIAYEISPNRSPFQPFWSTLDQFGSHSLEVLESKFLLVPTKKIAFRECIDPGNVNGDGKVSVSDVIYLINYLFKGGPPPIPELLVGDVNGDGKVTVSDVVYLINYLFKGGPPLGC